MASSTGGRLLIFITFVGKSLIFEQGNMGFYVIILFDVQVIVDWCTVVVSIYLIYTTYFEIYNPCMHIIGDTVRFINPLNSSMIQLDFSCAWVLFVFGIFWWFCMSIGIRIKHQIDIIQFATSPNLNMLEVAFREKKQRQHWTFTKRQDWEILLRFS